jgi:transposase-like protein
VERGLSGVKLVITGAHVGLKQAIAETVAGATWQRCRVHFMRNLLAQVPKAAQPMVAALVRSIFSQPDQAAARAQLRKVVVTLEHRHPKAAALLADAEEDVLAYMSFPEKHRRRLHSTNPLERLHKEIKRRSNVVGIFPNRSAVIRLVGAILMEQNDEWAVGRRYFSAECMAALDQDGGPFHSSLRRERPRPVKCRVRDARNHAGDFIPLDDTRP